MFRLSLCILVCLAGLASGCSTADIVARRVARAPNLQGGYSPKKDIEEYWAALMPAGSNSQVLHLTIPVGPPDAKLSIAELPPQNYHVKFESTVNLRTNGSGNLSLTMFTNQTVAFQPRKQPATIVVLHGYVTFKETMAPWAVKLAQSGYRVVLVDLRGHGESTGDTVYFGEHEADDLMQVLDYLVDRGLCDRDVGVLGLSYGATLALHWAAKDARIRTVVAIAPYNDPTEAFQRFARAVKLPVSQSTLRKGLEIAARKLRLNLNELSGEYAIRRNHEPVLLIGGEKDTISRPEDIHTLKEAGPPGTESLEVTHANHFAIGYWFKYLDEPVEHWFRDHLLPRQNVAANK